MKQRDLSLDLIRILACLMVVTTHAPFPAATTHSALLASISLVTVPCNALFFMVSGALLLPPPGHTTTPQFSTRAFLGKRLGKIVVPTLVWSAFYLVILALRENLGVTDIVRKVLSMPFSPQGTGVLWFMYALTGLYLLTPILSAWIDNASEREERLYLGLWTVTLCYPLLRNILDINDSTQGILYYFSGCAGFFLLGHYMQHYGLKVRLWQATLVYILALGIPLTVYLQHIDVDTSVFVNNYSSVFVAMQSVFWWTLLKTVAKRCNWSAKSRSVLAKLSALTFGIYLSHIFFKSIIFRNIPFIVGLPPFLQIFATIVLTFTIALGLSWLVSRTPVGSYVVGYRQRKKEYK